MGFRFKLPCGCFSDTIVLWEPQVGVLTWLLINPLRVLLFTRITDYREFHNFVGDGTLWADSSEFVAELLRTRYPRTLRIGLVPNAQSESENATLNSVGAKISSLYSPVTPRNFLCVRLRCAGSRGSCLVVHVVP